MTSLFTIKPLACGKGPDIHQCSLNIYLSEEHVDELLAWVLLIVNNSTIIW